MNNTRVIVLGTTAGGGLDWIGHFNASETESIRVAIEDWIAKGNEFAFAVQMTDWIDAQ